MVTIHRNRACGNSRDALAMSRRSDVEPEMIGCRETPPTHARLEGLIAAAGNAPRELPRCKCAPREVFGLVDPTLGDGALVDAMMARPINRSIVIGKRTRLRRPSEWVPAVPDDPDTGPCAKEDSEVVSP